MHCFSCGYHPHSKSSYKPPTIEKQVEIDTYPLPQDVEPTIPAKALDWLKKFHITYKDIIANQILWSEYRQLLIFPYDNAWQGRYFGNDPKHPKWFSRGKLDDIIHIKGLTNESEKVILVEDILSCIRVGKFVPTVCLFGSHVSSAKLARLKHVGSSYVWWLDYDKRDDAHRQALRAHSLGYNTSVIVTELDPKEYSDKEIREVLDKNGIM